MDERDEEEGKEMEENAVAMAMAMKEEREKKDLWVVGGFWRVSLVDGNLEVYSFLQGVRM